MNHLFSIEVTTPRSSRKARVLARTSREAFSKLIEECQEMGERGNITFKVTGGPDINRLHTVSL